MFWLCPKPPRFWSELFWTLSMADDTPITPEPLLALFGTPLQPLPAAILRTALASTTLLARRLILLNQKLPQPPSHNRWVREVFLSIKHERLRFSPKGSSLLFERTWSFLLIILMLQCLCQAVTETLCFCICVKLFCFIYLLITLLLLSVLRSCQVCFVTESFCEFHLGWDCGRAV